MKIKEELIKLLTYPEDTQYHMNLAGLYLNWFILILYLFFGKNAGLIGIGLSIIGLIVWEIIFWKGNWTDSLKDFIVGLIMIIPLSITIIKNT